MKLLTRLANFAVDVTKEILPEYAYQNLLFKFSRWTVGNKNTSSTKYWNSHHVTFEPSIEFVKYRRERYINYTDYLPASGHDNSIVLDYGCGPGIETAAILTESKNVSLYYADVSERSLEIAVRFLDKLGLKATPILLPKDGWDTGLDDNSVDYVHCVGVLHHTKYPVEVLKEIKRVLKPTGHVNLMVYHRQSVYFHLYIQYIVQSIYRLQSAADPKEVFREHTDGPNCPISHAWTLDDVKALCKKSGLKSRFIGTAYEPHDLAYTNKIAEAIYDERTSIESRSFLKSIKFDERMLPFFLSKNNEKIGAGLQLCVQLTK